MAAYTNSNIIELNNIIYTAATVASKEAGYSLKIIRTGAPKSKQILWINGIQEVTINRKKRPINSKGK